MKDKLLPDKEKRCCGNCCWFCFDDIDGWGTCCEKPDNLFVNCNMSVSDRPNCGYVSREEMRHYMAVLLKQKRWMDDDMFIHYAPDSDDVAKAIDFAVKYMKKFGNI